MCELPRGDRRDTAGATPVDVAVVFSEKSALHLPEKERIRAEWTGRSFTGLSALWLADSRMPVGGRRRLFSIGLPLAGIVRHFHLEQALLVSEMNQ